MALLKKIFTDEYFYLTLCVAVALVVFKIPHLFLPYYWDEAYPYSFAINHLYENGISLLPGAIPPEMSKGHPLLFPFLQSLWMKFFGTSLAAAKSFPLFISVTLLFAIYFYCKRFFNRIVAIAAVVLFAAQEIFLAQSSFVLPEMLLTLLTISSIHFYFSNRKLLYIISASMLCFTKESGIIPVALLAVWTLAETIFSKTKRKPSLAAMQILITVIPLIIISLFYLIQKFTYGWFFYPQHISYISLEWNIIKNILFSTLFYQMFASSGKSIMSIFFLISLIFFFLKGYKIETLQAKNILFISIFIIVFLVFSSINFYSNRYILCLFPLYIALCSFFIISAFRHFKVLYLAILISILAVKLYYTSVNRDINDTNLGFADNIQVHKEVVKYCEKNKLYEEPIFTHYLMMINLTKPLAGYLSNPDRPFNQVINNDNEKTNADIFIFSKVEYINLYDSLKKKYSLRLIRRFQKDNAWSEIYMPLK